MWLRSHQADDFAPCATALAADTGAIAYDDLALSTGRDAGVTTEALDQFYLATAQALPALQWAPAGGTGSSETVKAAYVKAGSKQSVIAADVAPGQSVCFARRGDGVLTNADATGTARGSVVLPGGSGERTYAARTSDRVAGTTSFHALAAKTLRVDRKTRVQAGKNQRLKFERLAPGESVRVYYKGKVVDRGTANAQRRYTARFPVGRKVGLQKVRVVGEFGNRTATKKFRVVKG